MAAPTPTPDRAAFRAALAALAMKTQSKMPALNGRVEKACKLVLAGDVELQGAKALVHSLSDPAKTYTLEPGHCTCADFPRAPEFLCAHRLAAGFARKLTALLLQEPTPAAAAPQICSSAVEAIAHPPAAASLPEAPASVNVHLTIGSRQVQLTLRDSDETRFLARLEAVLARFPLPQEPALVPGNAHRPQEGWCAIHKTAMRQTSKNGRAWWSHMTAQGWCKGR
jgi:hypothetical protein